MGYMDLSDCDTSKLDGCNREGRGDARLARTMSKAPKVPKRHTWTPYTLGAEEPKNTKRMILIRTNALLEVVNQLGEENAKLKNQIAALRCKQKAAK